MLKDQRKRKTRSDKGKPKGRQKRQIAPEYSLYLLTRDYRPRRLTEAELLTLLDQGCSLCGKPAERVRGGLPYCPRCWEVMRKRTEQDILSLAREVCAHRL